MSSNIIVMDPGSQCIKAGFASEQFPRVAIPSVLGRFRKITVGDSAPVYCFGSDAVKNQGISKLSWPVREGSIKDWDGLETLLHHVFYRELMIPPEEAHIMMAVHPLMSVADKSRILEILFETFAVDAVNLSASSVLTLHATGRTTGLVFESGAESSYVCPIFEGYPLRNATRTSHITGKLITENLKQLLAKWSYQFTVPNELYLLDELKRKYCHIAQLFSTEKHKYSDDDHKVRHYLPDGQYIQLGPERVQATEVFFEGTPEQPDIVNTFQSVLSACDMDYRAEFCRNIVISGGNCMFAGLTGRLITELSKKVKNIPNVDIKVDGVKVKQFTPWLGGSIMATLSSFKGFWISRQEYADHGDENLQHKFY